MSKWFAILKLIVPVVLAAVNPALAPLAGIITQGIGEAEQIPGATGADKLAHVVNLSVLSAQGVNAGAGRVIVDPTLVQSSAASAISTAVDIANLLHNQGTVPPPPGVATDVPTAVLPPPVPALPSTV